jgi:polyisoprenoid-binding protein YceI
MMPVSIVRRHALKALAATTGLIVLVLVGPLVIAMAAPGTSVPVEPPTTRGVAHFADSTRLDLTAGGSEARYRAQETLSGRGFNEAVGRTSGVQGGIALSPDGTVMADQSKITVDLTTLASDSSTRDNYIKRTTLQTAQYPTADFTITSAPGLPMPLPTGGTATFQLVGDLTVHGVTRPTTWDATATFADDQVTGSAATTVLISDFGMEPPKAGPVLSIEDAVRLELDIQGSVAPSIADLLSSPS